MNPTKTLLLAALLLVSLNLFSQKGFYNISDFGAKGDGKTLDTKAIQSAIDKCSENGGGTVFVPGSTFLTGCIILKSNVNLQLGNGAVLLGSANKDDYKVMVPDPESRTNDLYVNRSIIYADKAENISLTGNGMINGNGKHENYSVTRPQKNRPFLARFVNCKNVVIRDVSMNEAANRTCHLLGCKNVEIDGLKIKNSVRANRDGLDIDGCEDITVSNCRIHSMDDAIVLKSTGPAKVRNVTITNCIVSSHASGIKFGTETTGGFENITISNCIIKNIPVHSGIALMIVDGGIMKNILISNIVMDSVNIPLMVRLGNRARPYKKGIPTPQPGNIMNISISNVTATNAGQTSHITGLHGKRIKNISLNNINIYFSKEFKGTPMPYNEVPFKETVYPSGQLYGTALPAAAFYVRNVNILRFEDINVFFNKKDTRIPFVIDNASDIRMAGINAFKTQPSALIYLRNVNNCEILSSNLTGSSSLPFVYEEDNCKNIQVFPHSPPSVRFVKKVPALPDKTFEDIKGYSQHLFTAEETDGIKYYNLKNGKKTFELDTGKGKIFKLLFLTRSDQPATVTVTVNKESYKLDINNSTWQWNALNISDVNKNTKVKIRLESGSNAPVSVSKVVLIPRSVTD